MNARGRQPATLGISIVIGIVLPSLSAAAVPILDLEVVESGVRLEWFGAAGHDTTVFWTTTPYDEASWRPCAGPFAGEDANVVWIDEGADSRPSPNDDSITRRFYAVVEDSDALKEWPNEVSRANSDPWIVEHHDQIRKMRPEVLVLNFSNDLTTREATTIAKKLMLALEESSRWHGYDDPDAPAFFDFRVAKTVNLADDPPVQTCDGNSTKFPRKPNWTGGNNFEYSELYTETFAGYTTATSIPTIRRGTSRWPNSSTAASCTNSGSWRTTAPAALPTRRSS